MSDMTTWRSNIMATNSTVQFHPNTPVTSFAEKFNPTNLANYFKSKSKIEIDNVQKRIEQYKKEIEHFETVKKGLNSSTKIKKTITEEIDLIKTHHAVKKVKAEDGFLAVFTKHIALCGYDIGKYEIRIRPNSVTMFRVAGTVSGVHHPIVNGSGNPCWGNMASAKERYLKTARYSLILEICLSLLSSKDVVSPFLKVDEFIDTLNPSLVGQLKRALR